MKIQLKKLKPFFIFTIALAGVLFTGCNGGGDERSDLDSPTKGTIHISADESFKPVIDSEIQVFEALNPDAKIIAEYKSEADCFKDLMKDSTRLILVTRGLTIEEENFYKNKFSFIPRYTKVANDAIAVIVNKEAPDSVFYLSDLRSILQGTTADKQIAVFDGLSGSSAARFVTDSILKGKLMDPQKVFAEKSSQDVINYVEKNKDAVGFVGVSWIGNPEDTTQLSFLTKIRIASLQCKCPEKSFIKPYQANILTKRYPLVRGLYYILKENYNGLGSGFAGFLELEKGQLIFKRAYLGPAKINFSVRSAVY
jgi:phosphate transport system substrate-binding protein